RAELSTGGSRYAMTQALMFVPLSGLPPGTTIGVAGVMTSGGRGYTKTMVKGIIGATYDRPSATLALTLANPSDAFVTMTGDAPDGVSAVAVDGVPILRVLDQASFDAASTS